MSGGIKSSRRRALFRPYRVAPHCVVSRVKQPGHLPGHQGASHGAVCQRIRRALQLGAAPPRRQAQESGHGGVDGVAKVQEEGGVAGLRHGEAPCAPGQRGGGKQQEGTGQGPRRRACSARMCTGSWS